MVKFIPKLKESILLDLPIEEFFVDAEVVLRCHNVFSRASEKFPLYTIDPKTSRMQFDQKNESLRQLPYYVRAEDIQGILDSSEKRLHELIVPCIEFQIEKGSQHIIPPYFYTDDITSQTFNVNIENITNTIKYFETSGLDLPPIYPEIHLSKNILTNETALRFVVSNYTDSTIRSSIKGFYIVIDGFKTEKASEDELEGYLKLIRALSAYDVRLVAVNGFGYAGLLMGASCIISGLTEQESADINNWVAQDARSRQQEFTYVPEIFSYISEIELKKIPYQCSCTQCGGNMPSEVSSEKKKHFFYCKNDDLKHIFTGDFHENWENLKKVYINAESTAKDWIRNDITTRKPGDIQYPIQRWISVVNRAEEIYNLLEAEEELNQLLEALDENE